LKNDGRVLRLMSSHGHPNSKKPKALDTEQSQKLVVEKKDQKELDEGKKLLKPIFIS